MSRYGEPQHDDHGLGRPAVWASVDLLDRQLVDVDETPIGKVDDLELELPEDGGPPVVVAILSGAEALGLRLGGLLGRGMAGMASRLRLDGESARAVAMGMVKDAGPTVRLTAKAHEVGLEPALEVWLRTNVIERIPGGGHAPR